MINKNFLIGLVSALYCMNSYSTDFSYSYFEVAFGKSETEFEDTFGTEEIDADRFSLASSYELSDTAFLTLGYSSSELDEVADPEQEILSVGVGARLEVDQGLDIHGEFALINVKLKTSFESEDDNGFGIKLGLRQMLTEMLEINLDLSHLDAFDDTQTGVTLGGRAYLSAPFSLGVAYFKVEDTEGFDFSLRLSY